MCFGSKQVQLRYFKAQAVAVVTVVAVVAVLRGCCTSEGGAGVEVRSNTNSSQLNAGSMCKRFSQLSYHSSMLV